MFTTTIEWYKTADALPAKSGYYLIAAGTYIASTEYSSKYQLFNACDESDEASAKRTAIDCDYWAKLPEFPKTESEDDE